MTRDTQIAAFLTAHGYAPEMAEPLAQDASFRRYLRLGGGPRPSVLMDAPPPEDMRPFLRVACHLAGIGVSVPAILAADPDAGLLIEEDFGDGLFPGLLARDTNGALLDAAVDTLVAIQRSSPPWKPDARAMIQEDRHPLPLQERDGGRGGAECNATSDREPPVSFHCGPRGMDEDFAPSRLPSDCLPQSLPRWGVTEMVNTAVATLFDWWWPATFGGPAPPEARTDIADGLVAMLVPVAEGPVCFVHRDFFAGNLFWLPDRTGIRKVGLIDFQGAAIGHPAYDLVSLLQDARHDIPLAIQERAITRYLSARPDLDPTRFLAAYVACAAQRHLRVACQWVRLARRDGRPQYLAYGPRTWRLLDAALAQPAAAPLAAAMDRWIPCAMRRNPTRLAA